MTRPRGIRSTRLSTSSAKSTTPHDNGRVRDEVTGAHRVVVKVGSSALTTAAGGLDRGRVDALVDAIDTVATEEIRFGDNDRLAALVAALVHADLLVLLSDVDALYTGDPARPGARRIPEVRSEADLAGVSIGKVGRAGLGTGGMVTKVEAARIATGAGIPVVLTDASLAAA